MGVVEFGADRKKTPWRRRIRPSRSGSERVTVANSSSKNSAYDGTPWIGSTIQQPFVSIVRTISPGGRSLRGTSPPGTVSPTDARLCSTRSLGSESASSASASSCVSGWSWRWWWTTNALRPKRCSTIGGVELDQGFDMQGHSRRWWHVAARGGYEIRPVRGSGPRWALTSCSDRTRRRDPSRSRPNARSAPATPAARTRRGASAVGRRCERPETPRDRSSRARERASRRRTG